MKVSLVLALFFILFLGGLFSVFTEGWSVGLQIPLGGDVHNIFILLKNIIRFFQRGILWEAITHPVLVDSYISLLAKLFFFTLFIHLLREELRSRWEKKRHIRGSRFVKVEELRRELKKEKSRLRLGPLPFPWRYERQGIFLLGSAGSGKTVTLKHLLSQILSFPHPVLIYDRKPDYTLEFFREDRDLLFFPRDERSIPWNLFSEIEEGALLLDVDFLSSVLVPPASDPREQFWRDSAYHILRVVILKIWDSGDRTMRHFISYLRYLMTLSAEEILEELEETADCYGIGIRRYLTGKNMTTSILATLESYLQPLCLPELCHEGSFSVREFIRQEEKKRIYIVNTIRDEARYRPYFRCFIELAIRELLSLQEDPGRRVFFVLDEFQSLGKMEALETGIVEGRSKGFSPLIATQSLAQVQEIYGMERMRSIFQSCGTKIIHRYEEPEGTRFISDWLGDEEIAEKRYTFTEGGKKGRTHRWEKETRKVLLPSELTQLSEGEAVVKIGKYPPTKLKVPYRKYPQLGDWKLRKTLPECRYQKTQRKHIPTAQGGEGKDLEDTLRDLV